MTEENECIDCAEGVNPFDKCPQSKRPCGHHCNCVWVHDHCHWCGMESEETDNGADWPGDKGFEYLQTPVRNVLLDAAKGVAIVNHDPDMVDVAYKWLQEQYPGGNNADVTRARITLSEFLESIGY